MLAAVLLVPVCVRVVELPRHERQRRVVAELAVAVVHAAPQQRARLASAQRPRRQRAERHFPVRGATSRVPTATGYEMVRKWIRTRERGLAMFNERREVKGWDRAHKTRG